MKSFVLQPLVGVEEVRFGKPRAEVLRLLGEGHSFRKSRSSVHLTDAWHNNGFQVFYAGEEPLVEFIELSNDSGFEAVLFGLPVFSTPAQELIAHLEKHSIFDRNASEPGFSYVFPDLEASLWRPTEEDPHFKTVGVGKHGYYSG